MSTILTSPDITGINKLFEIYQKLPDRDLSITSMFNFHYFLCKNSIERTEFLKTYCEYEFSQIDTMVILKLKPKDD